MGWVRDERDSAEATSLDQSFDLLKLLWKETEGP